MIPAGTPVVIHDHSCAAQPVFVGIVRGSGRNLAGQTLYEIEIPGEGCFVALASCVAPLPDGMAPAEVAGQGGRA